MEIISHRGYWLEAKEKNSQQAFNRSFELGFGTETDVRDLDGQLVISHDIPSSSDNIITFEEFIKIYKAYPLQGTLALNIKADGLQATLKDILDKYKITNYFLFDASIPDQLVSMKANLKTFSRYSEYEPESSLFEDSNGVWLDNFKASPFESKKVERWLSMEKKVCVVSSELHGRDPEPFWNEIKRTLSSEALNSTNLILCTDLPENATRIFND